MSEQVKVAPIVEAVDSREFPTPWNIRHGKAAANTLAPIQKAKRKMIVDMNPDELGVIERARALSWVAVVDPECEPSGVKFPWVIEPSLEIQAFNFANNRGVTSELKALPYAQKDVIPSNKQARQKYIQELVDGYLTSNDPLPLVETATKLRHVAAFKARTENTVSRLPEIVSREISAAFRNVANAENPNNRSLIRAKELRLGKVIVAAQSAREVAVDSPEYGTYYRRFEDALLDVIEENERADEAEQKRQQTLDQQFDSGGSKEAQNQEETASRAEINEAIEKNVLNNKRMQSYYQGTHAGKGVTDDNDRFDPYATRNYMSGVGPPPVYFKDSEFDSEKYCVSVDWGDMTISYVPLPRLLPAGLRGRKMRATDAGGALKYPHRIAGDKQVFAMKQSTHHGGAVLIDTSGSMALEGADILNIMKALPGAVIAVYAGHGANGELRIVAKNGRRAMDDDLRLPGGANQIDGRALDWLCDQEGPRYFVTDAGFTFGKRGIPQVPGKIQLSEHQSVDLHIGLMTRKMRKYRVLMVNDVQSLLEGHLKTVKV